jgi:hypothetical protein
MPPNSVPDYFRRIAQSRAHVFQLDMDLEAMF